MTPIAFFRSIVLAAVVGVPLAAAAAEFPDGTTTPSADEVRQRLAGRVFDVRLADGGTWRIEYLSNGYFFVNTGTGGTAKGTWTVEDGRLCSALTSRAPNCNEVRIHDGTLHLRRDNGEVIRLVAR